VSDQATSLEDAARYRLPRTAVPRRYDLTLEPDLAAATFGGTCAVALDILEPTNTLVCNAVDLDISEAWLTNPAGDRIEIEQLALDDDLERCTIELASVPVGNDWTLHTVFTGELNDKLKGFYRSTYTDVDGGERVIATTQFEATDARRAFPCWDEPDLKAVFGVTLIVDDDLLAVSNAGEVARTSTGDGRVAVQFADTMVMSTYLVAFVVGPLEATAPIDVGGVPVRIVHPRGKGHLTDYALEVAAFSLDYFTEWYGIPYPGDKLDLVAVPDFAFGAMENLGCVTFREALLLVDPERSSQPELARVTQVIAHELAHMWFGDLVTMRWWNGIWLNEAFATFMEILCSDAFRPEWDLWTDFCLSRTAALDVDALRSTRPIEYPVVSPADAEGMFDLLTYEKGAAVVRMLEQYLGTDVFQAGVRSYLARHAYANTETTDLWDALEEASGEPVRRIADSWIFQGGFPLITVDLLHDGRILSFTQLHFRYLGDLGEGDEAAENAQDAQRWIIPALLTQRGNGVTTLEKVLIEGDRTDLELVEPVEWLLANTEGTGVYRTAYDPGLLEALAVRAQTELSPVERYGLIDDAFAAVLAGRSDLVTVLQLVERFADETDLAVWQRIIGVLRTIDRLVVDDDARHILAGNVHGLLAPAYERVRALHGPDDRARQLRGELFESLGSLGGDPNVAVEARTLHLASLADPDAADPAMVSAAIDVIAATGDAHDFEDFLARSKAATTPQEQLRYLGALADFEHDALTDRLVALLLTDEIRTQDAPYLLRRALNNRTQGPRVWAFVAERWDDLLERFPSNSIVRFLEGIRSLTDPDTADSVLAFFETHEVPQGDKILAQHLERLEVGVALRARDTEHLTRHLRHER